MATHAATPERNRGVPLNAPTFISVVVVNYNGRHYLEGCLRALAAQTCTTFEVLIVDNASTDDSVDWVAAHYPEYAPPARAA